jgi:hypothetical protein
MRTNASNEIRNSSQRKEASLMYNKKFTPTHAYSSIPNHDFASIVPAVRFPYVLPYTIAALHLENFIKT